MFLGKTLEYNCHRHPAGYYCLDIADEGFLREFLIRDSRKKTAGNRYYILLRYSRVPPFDILSCTQLIIYRTVMRAAVTALISDGARSDSSIITNPN